MPMLNPLWEVLEPYLVRLGVYHVSDPTYGRYTLPPHPPHLPILQNTAVTRNYRRIFLPPFESFSSLRKACDSTIITYAEDVEITKDEVESGVRRGGRWVFYSTWEMAEPPEGGWEGGGRGRGRDLVLVHGLNDYGLRYALHVQHFLNAGFRVIIPDLPSVEQCSTALPNADPIAVRRVHSYLPSVMLLTAALHAVLTDVVRNDLDRGKQQRQIFLSGASMGGWTVLHYILQYPPTLSSIDVVASASTSSAPHTAKGRGKGPDEAERSPKEEKVRVQVAGIFVLCPMVEVAKDSRPSMITEYIGRAILFVAGVMPLAKAVRGNASDDPHVEQDFDSDPLCYHGWLRVATGFALLDGMIELEKRAKEIDIPIRLVHGSGDRVTSHIGTLKLFDRLPNDDKEIEIYEGYEHVMLKVGRDEADDAQRQRVLADWREWLLQRCRN